MKFNQASHSKISLLSSSRLPRKGTRGGESLLLVIFFFASLGGSIAQQASPGKFRASVVKVDITPSDPQNLAGYAARVSNGVMHPIYHRIVAMHGHRHVDWIGSCGPLRIISAPSPVMGGRDDAPTRFHIHRLAPARDGGLALLRPQTVIMAGETDQEA